MSRFSDSLRHGTVHLSSLTDIIEEGVFRNQASDRLIYLPLNLIKELVN